MTDGELNEAVREMLTSGHPMSQGKANRLILSMLADIRTSQQEIKDAQADYEKRVKSLEDASIIYFIRRRPKLTALYVGLLLVLLLLLLAVMVTLLVLLVTLLTLLLTLITLVLPLPLALLTLLLLTLLTVLALLLTILKENGKRN
jgi:hypothetical protein